MGIVPYEIICRTDRQTRIYTIFFLKFFGVQNLFFKKGSAKYLVYKIKFDVEHLDGVALGTACLAKLINDTVIIE